MIDQSPETRTFELKEVKISDSEVVPSPPPANLTQKSPPPQSPLPPFPDPHYLSQSQEILQESVVDRMIDNSVLPGPLSRSLSPEQAAQQHISELLNSPIIEYNHSHSEDSSSYNSSKSEDNKENEIDSIIAIDKGKQQGTTDLFPKGKIISCSSEDPITITPISRRLDLRPSHYSLHNSNSSVSSNSSVHSTSTPPPSVPTNISATSSAGKLREMAALCSVPREERDVVWLLSALRLCVPPSVHCTDRICVETFKELKVLIKTADDKFWQKNCAQVRNLFSSDFIIIIIRRRKINYY